MLSSVHLGFEVGTGVAIAVPITHTCVTGVTQLAGKTTTLEAIIARSQARAITFVTKRAEGAFTSGRRIRPYFRNRSDWQFVSDILGSRLHEKLKFQRSWIMKLCRGARSLADVHLNCKTALAAAKRGLDQSVYTELDEYFEMVLPELSRLPYTDRLELAPGLNVMDLSAYSLPLQMLVLSSVLDWIYEQENDTLTVIPEAWEMIPGKRSSPVTRSAETLIRKSTAAHNFVLIDSQDASGVAIDVRRQVHLWILGVQREQNEINRTLQAVDVPGAIKPKAADIRALGRGEFYVCWGREVKKVYVQPAWMDDDAALDIAIGARKVEDLSRATIKPAPAAGLPQPDPRNQRVVNVGSLGIDCEAPIEPGIVVDPSDVGLELIEENGTMDSHWREKYLQAEEERVALVRRVEELEAQLRSTATPAAVPERNGTPPAFDKEALYSEFRSRLLKEPPVVKAIAAAPALVLEERTVDLTFDSGSFKGRIARLIAHGFFDSAKKSRDVYMELKRTGGEPNNKNLSMALDEFRNIGLLTEEPDGFQAVANMKRKIIQK